MPGAGVQGKCLSEYTTQVREKTHTDMQFRKGNNFSKKKV